MRLNISIFMLHLLITAVFFVVPLLLRDAGVADQRQWLVYLPSVIVGVGVMIPLIIWGERKAMRVVLLLCILGLFLTQWIFAGAVTFEPLPTWILLFLAITCFFSFMNTLEALLPSLVSRLAPAASRGSAMGIYSSSQFFGAFLGGTGAGWLYGEAGAVGVFQAMAVLCACWGILLWGFQPPGKKVTHRQRMSAEQLSNPDAVLARWCGLPGVEEVVFAEAEGMVYVKVDKNSFKGFN